MQHAEGAETNQYRTCDLKPVVKYEGNPAESCSYQHFSNPYLALLLQRMNAVKRNFVYGCIVQTVSRGRLVWHDGRL